MKNIIKIILIFIIISGIVLGAKILLIKPEEKIANVENEEVKGINIEDLVPVSKQEVNENREKIREKIKNNKKIILYYYADWCGMCTKISKDMDKLIDENKDIEIIKIDTEIEKDLKEEYNIEAIPTLILIKNQEEIDRIVEITDMEIIKEFIKK